jgi:signal transduction histidine kinase
MYIVLAGELGRSFDATLRANAEHAAGAFAQDIDQQGNLRPAARLIGQFASTGGRVVVLDATGAEVVDSAPLGTGSLPVAESDIASARQHANILRDASVDGKALRLTVEPIVLPDGRLVGYVAWADTTRPLRDLLATVGAALVIGGIVVIALALIAGLILAGRALKPVADVTDTARSISLSGDFGARVDAGRPGDEIGELAVAFNEMLAALEENHQALQEFLEDASHELRTPLTVIRANLDLARRPDVPSQERRAILADARDEAERMGRLVSDLLSLARAESGSRLEFEAVEIDALLVESVRRQHQAAPHVRMSVTRVEPALVDGDRDRLRELLGILLDNAARYTPESGSVGAAIERRGHQVVVLVEDTGIGLDAEDRVRVFERLYRGQRARAMQPSGTGLGLAIAHWIVESHGGSIELVNRAGGGTTAKVTLPMRGA